MKLDRQEVILQLIEEHEIETQEDLAALLREAGYAVTQATVSRDIAELKLLKITGKSGRMIYTAPPAMDVRIEPKYTRVLKESVLSIEPAMNLLVIRTIPGMAMGVAAALDSCAFREIVGSIAGDDTIMCATRSVRDAAFLKNKVERLTGAGE